MITRPLAKDVVKGPSATKQDECVSAYLAVESHWFVVALLTNGTSSVSTLGQLLSIVYCLIQL